MQRTFKITVDGRPYNVTVEEVSETQSLTIPGPGDMTVAQPRPVAPVAVAPKVAAAGPAPSAEPGDEVSPLAGIIVSIDVAEGQEVAVGDKVATIEAMKMKTIVAAHRPGKVTRILVKAGDGVEPGQSLLSIG